MPDRFKHFKNEPPPSIPGKGHHLSIKTSAERVAEASAGAKIIEGLKDAVAGNFSGVTIEGQRWVREPEWRTMDDAPRNCRPFAVIKWWPDYVKNDGSGKWGNIEIYAFEADPTREQCWTDERRQTCIREDKWIWQYRWAPLPTRLTEAPVRPTP